MTSRNYNAEQNALRKFNAHWLDDIRTPAGHIFSLIVEELEIEKPNLDSMISEVNRQIVKKGSVFSQIKNMDDIVTHSGIRYDGIISYLRNLKKKNKINWKFMDRISDELYGIIPEDRIFERDKTLKRYHSN